MTPDPHAALLTAAAPGKQERLRAIRREADARLSDVGRAHPFERITP